MVAKRDLLEQAPECLPGYLRLANHAAADSMMNTPPVFCIYIANLVLEWFQKEYGDLATIGKFNEAKSALVYRTLQEFPDVYQLHAAATCRSRMNVTFRLPNDQLEQEFLEQAEQRNLYYLAGHRSVGGIRASLYNAMPMEGAQALADFIRAFAIDR